MLERGAGRFGRIPLPAYIQDITVMRVGFRNGDAIDLTGCSSPTSSRTCILDARPSDPGAENTTRRRSKH